MAEDEDDWARHMRQGRERHQGHYGPEALSVVTALRDGDLRPLADYLKSGGLPGSPRGTVSLPQWLADDLVAMIEEEPWSWFHLFTKGRKKGERGWSNDLEIEGRDTMIGFVVESKLRQLPRGHYDSVVSETSKRFRTSEATVRKAHSNVKKYLRHADALGVDGWRVLQDYATRNE